MIVVANKRKGARGVYIGRPSVLGNPFQIGPDGTRAEVIEKYRSWIESEVRTQPDGPVARELDRLRARHERGETVTLVCWCAPAPCHGDVIRDLISGIKGES